MDRHEWVDNDGRRRRVSRGAADFPNTGRYEVISEALGEWGFAILPDPVYMELLRLAEENAQLRAAASKLLEGFDAGVLCRDISHDGRPDYAFRFPPYAPAIKDLVDLCGHETRQEPEVTPSDQPPPAARDDSIDRS